MKYCHYFSLAAVLMIAVVSGCGGSGGGPTSSDVRSVLSVTTSQGAPVNFQDGTLPTGGAPAPAAQADSSMLFASRIIQVKVNTPAPVTRVLVAVRGVPGFYAALVSQSRQTAQAQQYVLNIMVDPSVSGPIVLQVVTDTAGVLTNETDVSVTVPAVTTTTSGTTAGSTAGAAFRAVDYFPLNTGDVRTYRETSVSTTTGTTTAGATTAGTTTGGTTTSGATTSGGPFTVTETVGGQVTIGGLQYFSVASGNGSSAIPNYERTDATGFFFAGFDDGTTMFRNTPPQMLPNLNLGQSFSQTLQEVQTAPGTAPVTSTITHMDTLVRFETTTVAAGTFNNVAVIHTDETHTSPSTSSSGTVTDSSSQDTFLAPGVGVIKDVIADTTPGNPNPTRTTQELVSATIGGAAIGGGSPPPPPPTVRHE